MGDANVQFAVVSSSKVLDAASVAFAVEAVRQQVIAAAKDWNLTPFAVAVYTGTTDLPANDCIVCEIVDDLDEPGALGFHSASLGLPYARILAQGDQTSITLSHEALETLCDPLCDKWLPMGDGRKIALEVCDPVEGDTYELQATIAGESHMVLLSNYVLPPYFDVTTPVAVPMDKLGKIAEPFAMTTGGYYVVEDAAGNDTEVFARRHVEGNKDSAREKLRKPEGRLTKRLGGPK